MSISTFDSKGRRPWRLRLSAGFAALGLLAASCGTSSVIENSEAALDSGSADTESTPPSDDAESSAEKFGPSTSTTEPQPIANPTEGVDAVPLDGSAIEAGTYGSDLLGTPISFSVGDGWVGAFGDPGAFIIDRLDKTTPFSEGLIFARMSSFGGEEDITTEPAGPALSGPSQDIDAWLKAGDFIVSNETTSDLDGNRIRQFDLVLDPSSNRTIPGGCGPGPEDRCFFVGGTYSEALAFYIVRTTEVYRMWHIEQRDEDPILIVAIASEGNEEFFSLADELVATMAVGAVMPHPVVLEGNLWELGRSGLVPAGEATFPALGGLSLNVPSEQVIMQDQNFLGFSAEPVNETDPVAPQVAFAQVNYDDYLNEVSSVADALAILSENSTLTPLDPVTMVGQEFYAYEIEARDKDGHPTNSFSPARIGEQSNFRFHPGPYGVVFLAQAETGVYMFSYDSFSDEGLAPAKALFDQIVPTIELNGGGGS